jgi:hypothetical protein
VSESDIDPEDEEIIEGDGEDPEDIDEDEE